MDTKKLRQKILDLAIHGKLVPQDPNDEPASVLLERIKAEKERLIKEGKIKRTKKSAKASDTPHYTQDVPFEIPSSWVWTILGEIFQHNNGKQKTASNHIGNYHKYITTSNVYWGKFDFTEIKEMRFLDSELDKYTARKGDLLVCEGGDIGRAAIWNFDSTICIQNHLHRLRAYIPICTKYFLFSLMYSKYRGDIKGKGIGLMSLSANDLHNIPIALPPIAEQERIVAEVERWFALIVQLEQDESDLQAVIKHAKSKILDLAIHGKLVPQDPNDEPASELLKRINPQAEITCDNGHSGKLPQGWYSLTINDVCSIIGGVSYNKADIQNIGIRVLRGGNIQNGKVFCCSDDVFIPFSYQNKENQVQYGDIIVVASTGSQTLIGKTGFVDSNIPKTQIGAFLRIVRPKQKALSPYIHLLFQTDAYKDYIRNAAKGSNINNVKNAHLQNYQICLPPLAEQQRIVDKIEELFSVLDNIQNALEA